MTLNEYQRLAQRTARKDITPDDHLMNGILGLSGETGECADLVKKSVYQDGRDIRDLNQATFAEGIYMAAHRKDYEQAVQMYGMGMSVEEVADYYGVTRQSMWMCLKRRGVEFRDNRRYGTENHFYRGTKANDHAQNVLEKAIEKGIVKRREKCEICGAEYTFRDGRSGIQAHHCDYNRPFDVMWLCQKCHHEWHTKNKAKEVVPGEAMPRTTVDVLSGGFP